MIQDAWVVLGRAARIDGKQGCETNCTVGRFLLSHHTNCDDIETN